MATKPKKTAPLAGVYVRISQDRAGDELGVDRQREDCEKLAKRQGWTVSDVFVDDDRSAYSGKPRPGYDRLLEALKSGTITAVVVWHPDRLHRSPRELEGFIDVVEASGAQIATVTAGELDLATASGRMTARIVGAVARHESEHKSERIRRQRDQMALQGRPHGGRRAFGYRRGGQDLDEKEAELVREAARRALAGESIRSIARDWNDRAVPSSSGREWTIVSLRQMLTGPRLAGLRVHRGEVVGRGTWRAILTRAEHDEIRAVLGNPRVHRTGRPATSLLGGLIVCGECGAVMHASTRTGGTRRYVCHAQPGKTGCGCVAIQAERTEAIVVEAVMRRLDTPELARTAAEPPDSPGVEIPEIESRLAELADLFGDGTITRTEWMRARTALEDRLTKARSARDDAAGTTTLAPYRDGALRDAWPDLTTDQQRGILAAVIDRVVIAPAATPGRFDDERISIPPDAWRA
jgi:site-specific DNA recombinase